MDRQKDMLDFKIEQIKPFYGNETWRCNEDGTCYENWLAMKFPPGNATWEPNFKNKCYYDHVNELQCFPHVHMVGWAKSGTTDMWYYFQQHPELIHGWKETQWLTQFNFYLPRHNHMRKFHNCMSNWFKERVSDIKVNPNYAMLDSTATIIYDNWHWRIKQGYSGDPLEPTHTNFHYIRHIHPGAQIIVMMRNPVTRALSFYNHGIDMTVNHNANLKFEYPTEPKSNHDIDTFFQDSIKYFNQCVKNYTLRYCCHMPGWDSQDWGDPQKFMTLRIGIYYIFLEEVFKNFPPEQVKLVMAEDFYGNTHEALDDVFTFLNISTDHTKDMIEKKGDYIVMKIKKYFKPLSKTYQLLQQFYEPFNKRLSDMLNDDKWHELWAQEVTRKLDNLS